jgi:hypothetical protein
MGGTPRCSNKGRHHFTHELTSRTNVHDKSRCGYAGCSPSRYRSAFTQDGDVIVTEGGSSRLMPEKVQVGSCSMGLTTSPRESELKPCFIKLKQLEKVWLPGLERRRSQQSAEIGDLD